MHLAITPCMFMFKGLWEGVWHLGSASFPLMLSSFTANWKLSPATVVDGSHGKQFLLGILCQNVDGLFFFLIVWQVAVEDFVLYAQTMRQEYALSYFIGEGGDCEC